jgi:hypothetical protein
MPAAPPALLVARLDLTTHLLTPAMAGLLERIRAPAAPPLHA